MAGSIVASATPEGAGPGTRRWMRGVALAMCLSIGGILAAPAAQAQVPALPAIPAPVQDAIQTAQDTLIPVLVQGAIAAQPASNAVGFGLRPGCAGAGTAILLVVLLGGGLPFSPGFVSTPLLIFCAGAFAPGPADPVFSTVDGAAGSQVEGAAGPVLDQVGGALAPVRPQLSDVCGVIALAGSTPTQVPPPFNRFDLTKTVCFG